MKDPLHHDPLDALGDAYEKLYEHVAKNLHNAEKKTEPLFHKLIEEVREKAGKFKELSEHDADKIAHWIKRDMTELTNYLSETGHELKDWLGFETSLVENEFLDLLLKAADQTTAKILEIKDRTYLTSTYHTGEIVGPGTLKCDKCMEHLHFHRAGKIPPCPKCHATNFHRSIN